MARSQNGYRANVVGDTAVRRVPGTTREVRLRKGPPGWLLLHFAGWFDKAIESVDGGILDDWGYAERPIRGSSTTLSNHASGTALDLHAPRHPLGVRGTFSAEDAAKIRAQLRRYDGAIRWGGDYVYRADEMHFELMVGFVRAALVTRRIKSEDRATASRKAPKLPPIILLGNVRREFAKALDGRDTNRLPAVKRIQRALNARYDAGLTVDGYVGPATLDAWRHHEREAGRSGRPGMPDRQTLWALSGSRFRIK